MMRGADGTDTKEPALVVESNDGSEDEDNNAACDVSVSSKDEGDTALDNNHFDDNKEEADDDDDDSSTASSVSSSSSSAASTNSMSTMESKSSESSGSVLSSDLSSSAPSNDDDEGSDNDDNSLSELSARLRRKFDARDKMLKKIARDNKGNKAYMEFLRRSEAEVRDEAMRLLKDRRWRRSQSKLSKKEVESGGSGGGADAAADTTADTDDDELPRTIRGIPPRVLMLRKRSIGLETDEALAAKSTANNGDTTTFLSTPDRSLVKSILRSLRFEFYHTIPGLVTFVLYCVAHLSVYELLSNIFLEITKYTERPWLVYTVTFFISLILPRLTGGLWNWVNDDTYFSVKFDMHNRLRLNRLDARIMRWFRRHRTIKCTIDVVCLYLCFMTMSYCLQYVVMPALLDVREDVLSNLPSMRHNFCKTRLQEILGDGISSSCSNIDLGGYTDEKACFDDSDALVEGGEDCYNSVELAKALAEEDEEYLVSKVSVSTYYGFVGDNATALTRPVSTILFFASVALLSIGAVSRLGFYFWD